MIGWTARHVRSIAGAMHLFGTSMVCMDQDAMATQFLYGLQGKATGSVGKRYDEVP